MNHEASAVLRPTTSKQTITFDKLLQLHESSNPSHVGEWRMNAEWVEALRESNEAHIALIGRVKKWLAKMQRDHGGVKRYYQYLNDVLDQTEDEAIANREKLRAA